MEESVSGFKTRGEWVEVVEHGERIVRALRDLAEDDVDAVDEDALEEFEEWRPKSHERLDEDVSEKTAEQASVSEGEGEKAGQEPDEDLQKAGEKLTESYENLEEVDEAVDKWGESLDYVARAADSASRKAIRAVEGAVYKNVMTQIAPYYFDNELVSANLRRAGREDPEYVFEVNINDDDLKIRVSNRLADLERAVDRWHVDTEKDTDSVAAAEGVEPPEPNDDVDAETN
jgi:O6-methylguanine-DNA--protein-cysteine methyltransferase